MPDLRIPCLYCDKFRLFDTGGGTFISFGTGCELELEPHPNEDDIIGCSEFELRPTFRERLEIGQAVEELIQSLDEKD